MEKPLRAIGRAVRWPFLQPFRQAVRMPKPAPDLVFPAPIPYKHAMTAHGNASRPGADHFADLLVLGAGASGLFCALTAARKAARAGAPRRILLVDRDRTPARKLRASGGGRCNCTNAQAAPERYLGRDPRFTTQALARFTPARFLETLAGLGLSASLEDGGKYFCDQGAAALALALERACREAGCAFRLGVGVAALAPPEHEDGALPKQADDLFRVELEDGGALFAPRVALALGSPAWPALGGTDIVARLAGQLGLPHLPARPALAPLLLSGPDGELCRGLSGLSLPVRALLPATPGGPAVTDSLLFTHQGLSGPAALRISSHWRRGETLRLDLAPGLDLAAWLREPARGRMQARGALAALLPRRLAEGLAARLPEGPSGGLATRRLAECSRADLSALARLVNAWDLLPTGTGGMARAEAASGGLDTASFSPKTMQCKSIPGLFAMGEALDIAGDLGGFNLHWAWASAHAAGQSA